MIPFGSDPEAQKKFLNALRDRGVIRLAADAASISTSVIYGLRKEDEDFGERMEAAMLDYKDKVEAEVLRRAVDGYPEAVTYQGQVTCEVTKYSDRLLELVIKRHKPEYRDKHQIDVNATGGVLVVPGREMSVDEWEKQQRGGAEQ